MKNVHSKRASGLVNVKTIGVEACSDGKGVVLVTRKQNAGRCPNIQYRRTELKKGARNTLNVIRNTISKNKYRKDLKNVSIINTNIFNFIFLIKFYYIIYSYDEKNYRLNVVEFIFSYINVTIRQCLRFYSIYSLFL